MLIVSISWWFYHLGRRKVLVHGKLYAKLCYMCVAVFLFVVVFLQMSRLQSMFTVRMNERMNLATAPWYYRHCRICLWKWMSKSWVTCYMCISISGSCQICCILYAMTVHTGTTGLLPVNNIENCIGYNSTSQTQTVIFVN